MKNIAIILSVYIVILLSLPCIDEVKHHVTGNPEISQQTDNEHHQHETDQCSPFCTCDCCISPILHYNGLIDRFITVSSPNEYPGYFEIFNSFLYNFIWQPPKIV